MFHATQVGLGQVLRRMREFAANPHAEPGSWKPSKLLVKLAAEGRAFDDPPAPARTGKQRAKGKSRG
jgi:3-hydroxyacyl-CoA dehydrogenase